MQQINPCLWFDDKAEEAVRFYTSILPNSKIGAVSHYGDAGPRPKGTVMTVTFHLNGQEFMALNGGPEFKFNHAISFMIKCESQEEIDRYWDRLSAGGKQEECGWVMDRYGVSWQIIPATLERLITDPDGAKAERVKAAILKMKKLDIAELKRAHAGR